MIRNDGNSITAGSQAMSSLSNLTWIGFSVFINNNVSKGETP